LRRAASKRSCSTEIFEVVGQLLSEPSGLGSQLLILRAQTLTLLEALGPGHKRILLQFLYELSLLGPEKPGLSLQGANLREANLKEADLSRAFLQGITKEDSLKRRSMRRSETMLPSSQTTSSAPRTGEAVWEEEVRRELKRDVLPDRPVDALRLVLATNRQRSGNRLRELKVVVGVGGLGHMAVQILKALAPARILAVDEAHVRLPEGSLNGRVVVCQHG
jgi:Pentapeptide repeats (8 copies)